MAFCGNCGTQLADSTTHCPNCGQAVTPAITDPSRTPTAPASAQLPLEENVAGMLAYFTILPAILFLLIEPYNRNTFVRFHSFQCIFLTIALMVISGVLKVISVILLLVPMLGWLIVVTMWPLWGLAVLVLWLLVVIKAFQHEIYKLPVIGDIAQRQAGA
jgi:uncharacterized membrane protein